MIVVLGRPRVYRPEPDGDLAPVAWPSSWRWPRPGPAVEVELVGAIGDDPEGDRIVVELGRGGVGHSALLRDHATRTPLVGQARDARPLPRLEAADVELGMRYMHECRVLVISAELGPGGAGPGSGGGCLPQRSRGHGGRCRDRRSRGARCRGHAAGAAGSRG